MIQVSGIFKPQKDPALEQSETVDAMRELQPSSC